ncbi:hypothetical protein G4228_000899 [Cervus hanglu yarkandensis]|nr:hypothetical protein G4228_000899 [Cervus hanglu yarkandensis]
MATQGFYCLLLPISEIDLPVKRREYINKTRKTLWSFNYLAQRNKFYY